MSSVPVLPDFFPAGSRGRGREGSGRLERPSLLLLGWRAEELRLRPEHWDEGCLWSIPGKGRIAPLMGTEPRWSNLEWASPLDGHPLWMSIPFQMSIPFRISVPFTESQNVRGWNVPLWVS